MMMDDVMDALAQQINIKLQAICFCISRLNVFLLLLVVSGGRYLTVCCIVNEVVNLVLDLIPWTRIGRSYQDEIVDLTFS
jgi:hypothetical protein